MIILLLFDWAIRPFLRVHTAMIARPIASAYSLVDAIRPVFLVLAALPIYSLVVAGEAKAQASQVYKIDDPASIQDIAIARKYMPNIVEGTEIRVKHIRNVILFHVSRNRDDIFEKQNGLIFYTSNQRDFAVLADLGGDFYYPDVVVDNCDQCVGIRLGNYQTQEGDLVVASDYVFLSLKLR
jgi:hypothetical protein